MINNIVLVSGVKQSDSVIHLHLSILFQVVFPLDCYSSLCYTVGPCWLSILNISVYMLIPNSQSIIVVIISYVLIRTIKSSPSLIFFKKKKK